MKAFFDKNDAGDGSQQQGFGPRIWDGGPLNQYFMILPTEQQLYDFENFCLNMGTRMCAHTCVLTPV